VAQALLWPGDPHSGLNGGRESGARRQNINGHRLPPTEYPGLVAGSGLRADSIKQGPRPEKLWVERGMRLSWAYTRKIHNGRRHADVLSKQVPG